MNRRQFLVAAASLPAVLAACGEDEPEPTSGPWTFTDDRDVEVSLPRRPERLVMHEYALAALWDYGIRPVGMFGSVAMDEQPLFEGLDLGGVESVGEVWGEINLEAAAALRPDLFISTYWPSEKLLGGVKDDRLERKLTAIAPFVGIHAQVPATTTIAHFEKLAGALGGEPARAAAARERYERAVDAVRAAAEAKPELRVMGVYADPEALYVAKPEDYSDLREFGSWGLDLVAGKSGDPYWEKLSWEQADKYPADLILYDARATAPSLDDLAEIPLWRDLPAVKAGQLTPWHMEEAVSWRLFASHAEELAAAIERARVVA
jgi:iron complex transport system substrate-binding protein